MVHFFDVLEIQLFLLSLQNNPIGSRIQGLTPLRITCKKSHEIIILITCKYLNIC